MSLETASPRAQSAASAATRAFGTRATRILLPLLLLYLVNFIDRNNISFAVIGGMNTDLHIGNADAGLAGGLFYAGYLILQIPSGILAERFDVKNLIVLLGVVWGVLAMATGLSQNLAELLVLRFLLGLVEGCVWTAILVLLSRWFTDRERATANSLWLLCLPLSFIVMGPISGLIVRSVGWRWLFVVEGAPAVLFSLLVWTLTAARPQDAAWLPAAERDRILGEGPDGTGQRARVSGYRQAIWHPQVLLLSFVYLFWLIGAVGFFTWVPSIVEKTAKTGLATTGFLSALPYVAALIGLALIGRFADRTRRRALFVGVDLACFGVALLVSTLAGSHHLLSLAFLVVAGFFLFAMHAPFWSIPMETLPAALTGAAMGMISMIGNIGSFVGPYLMGAVQQATGSFDVGMYVLIGSLLIAAVLTVFVAEHPELAEHQDARNDEPEGVESR
jgi:sugar phosphate permease